jgi:hypothetical protein
MSQPIPPHAERTALMVKCQCCGHVWPALWFPCDALLIGKATPKVCLWCGVAGKKNLFLASREAGDLDRYVEWLEVELARARAEAAIPPDGVAASASERGTPDSETDHQSLPAPLPQVEGIGWDETFPDIAARNECPAEPTSAKASS